MYVNTQPAVFIKYLNTNEYLSQHYSATTRICKRSQTMINLLLLAADSGALHIAWV